MLLKWHRSQLISQCPLPGHTEGLQDSERASAQRSLTEDTNPSKVCCLSKGDSTAIFYNFCQVQVKSEKPLWRWSYQTQGWMTGSPPMLTWREWRQKKQGTGQNGTTKPSICSPVWASVWDLATSGGSLTCVRATEEVGWGDRMSMRISSELESVWESILIRMERSSMTDFWIFLLINKLLVFITK